MLYKPAYCSHCGEKIERTETLNLLDGGRFCDVCKKDFLFQEWFPKGLMILFLLIGISGIGGYLMIDKNVNAVALKQNKTASTEKNVKTEAPANAAENSKQAIVQKNENKDESVSAVKTNKIAEKQKAEPNLPVAESVYFCGAPTKKGTACSRKVKGGGRCWQHKGLEAILPPEKLLITQ